MTDRDAEDPTLEQRCLELLRKFHATRGAWKGYDEHPYQEAYKPWFFEDDAKELAAFVRAEIAR